MKVIHDRLKTVSDLQKIYVGLMRKNIEFSIRKLSICESIIVGIEFLDLAIKRS